MPLTGKSQWKRRSGLLTAYPTIDLASREIQANKNGSNSSAPRTASGSTTGGCRTGPSSPGTAPNSHAAAITLDRTKRWFPAEREQFLPLIEAKEKEIWALAVELSELK